MSVTDKNTQKLDYSVQKDIEPLSEGWHYLDFHDGGHSANYIEWKYFNFKQKDIAGYIVYFVLDPERKTKVGGARVLARVYHKEKFSGAIRQIPIDDIELQVVSAEATMGEEKILEKDQHEYEINGTVDHLSWNLLYTQLVPSIDGFKDARCGVLRWEQADWLVKMPRAKVKGTIKTDDGIIEIDAIGYSDTNWGEFLPFFSKYEWGQYNDEKISFIFGVLYKLFTVQCTYFYLVVDQKIVWFENPQFSVKHTKWGTNGSSTIKIPLESEFVVRDKQYLIRFTSRLINSDLLGLKISLLLPKAVVSEQIVQYKGVIEKNGIIMYEFDGLGFEECSTKTYKETPIAF